MSAGWRSFARAQADAATTTASDAARTNRTREFYYYVRMGCDRRAFLTTVTAVTGLTALPAAQSADRPPSPPLAGLNPGVRLVPAHTMMIGLVQERGFTYEKP